MAPKHMFLFSCLVILGTLHGIHTVEFDVINNAEGSDGGSRFDNEIGTEYSKSTLSFSTFFIWDLFQQHTDHDRKDVQKVTLIIEIMDGVAYTAGDEIHFSANYIGDYSGDVKTEFTGVVFHEMTHVWQWNGAGEAPGGLIEGIADFVRLSADLAPGNWVKPGEGDRWDQGYDVTARFLDYCNGLSSDFVAELNEKMRDGYSDDFFLELLGETVDELWSDYKDMYGKKH